MHISTTSCKDCLCECMNSQSANTNDLLARVPLLSVPYQNQLNVMRLFSKPGLVHCRIQ